MNKDLQVGQRVRLSPDSKRRGMGDMNPINSEGLIVTHPNASQPGDSYVLVIWANGMWNDYPPQGDDLIPLD